MKIRLLALAILAFTTAVPICSAGNVVVGTPSIYVVTGDFITCTITNISDKVVDFTVSLHTSAGVQSTATVTLAPRQTTGIPGVGQGDYYFCISSFKGKKTGRGGMFLYSPGSLRPYMEINAN